jgi:hypothetical protein
MTNSGTWEISVQPMLSECPFCNKPVLAYVQGTYVENQDERNGPKILHTLASCGECTATLLLGHEETDIGWSSPVRLYPATKDHSLSPYVPQELRREHKEARDCFSIRAYTATAVMVRRTLEGVCQEQGIVKKQPLAESLRQLRDDGKIEGRLLDWAEALRFLGNQGAHYTGTPVSREDAADALAFAEALLDYMYVLTAQYEKFQRRRSASQQTSTGPPQGTATVPPQPQEK